MKTQEELKKLTTEERECQELNDCDKCGFITSTYELIWVTPDEDNIYPEVIHKTKYDALCADCFAHIVEDEPDKNVIIIRAGQDRLDDLYAMLPEDDIKAIVSEIVELELELESNSNQ